jgi:L-cystine transport system substrate-binding protein
MKQAGKPTWKVAVALLLAALALAGCGGASADEGKSGVKKIIVGTGTQFPKVAFIDENGKLTGFDVELVRELDKRLPQYEFELQTMDFSNILLSLETGKIDFGAHEFGKNPEREEKYLFNKVPYAYWRNFIIVSKNNNDPIESLKEAGRVAS